MTEPLATPGAMPHTLTVEQAAKILGISRGSCYEMVNSGRLHSLQIGRRRLIPRAVLLSLLGEKPPSEPRPTEGGLSDAKPWYASDPDFLWNALRTIEDS